MQKLGCCDALVTYGDEAKIDTAVPAVYVDMSGDTKLRAVLHNLMGANMVASESVGATHWEAWGAAGELPGATPRFFFAPSQIDKREADWGPGVAMMRAMTASADVAGKVQGSLAVEWVRDAPGLAAVWNDLLDNKVAPNRGLMVSLL